MGGAAVAIVVFFLNHSGNTEKKEREKGNWKGAPLSGGSLERKVEGKGKKSEVERSRVESSRVFFFFSPFGVAVFSPSLFLSRFLFSFHLFFSVSSQTPREREMADEEEYADGG